MSPREEIIRGSLKYSWKEGRSIARASDPFAKSEPAISSVPERLTDDSQQQQRRSLQYNTPILILFFQEDLMDVQYFSKWFCWGFPIHLTGNINFLPVPVPIRYKTEPTRTQ